jgi:hypothetical protein
MIQHDIVDAIRHLLCLCNRIYGMPLYDFHPTLHYATNLQDYENTTLFLAADTYYFRGTEICV